MDLCDVKTKLQTFQAPIIDSPATNGHNHNQQAELNYQLCNSYSDNDSDTESIDYDEPLCFQKLQTDLDNRENNYQIEDRNFQINNTDPAQSFAVQLRPSRKSKFEIETLNAVDNSAIVNKKLNKLDSVRFSMYNIQDSHSNEIDALLSELNQLQTTMDYSKRPIDANLSPFPNIYRCPMSHKSPFYAQQPDEIDAIDEQFDQVLKFLAESIGPGDYSPASHQNDSSGSSPSFNLKNDDGMSGSASSGIGEEFLYGSKSGPTQEISSYPTAVHKKRNSTDSAFGDTISMPSSVNLNHSLAIQQNSFTSPSESSEPSPAEVSDPKKRAELLKAEQIRLALEKLKEANIKKIIVKAYTDDGCAKSVIIDETLKVYDVLLMLLNKNHRRPTLSSSVVEFLPKLSMERVFEDHENLVEAMSHWSRDSENQILFSEREEKKELFLNDSIEVEGPLYFKLDSKKTWKKSYCVLRQSGLYVSPKGKGFKKDLQCLFNFDKLDLYHGIGWMKELKAPTDFCFALKHPQVQKKSSKYIKYVCCETSEDKKKWFNGIRFAKFGKQLQTNHQQMLDLIKISETTGRIPLVQNRRLSTSASANHIRPRSSFGLVNQHSGVELASNHCNTGTLTNIGRNSLITATKESGCNKTGPTENSSIIEPLLQIRNELANNKVLNRTSSNVSYTEQLKSLLQAHQTQNQNLKRDIKKEENESKSISTATLVTTFNNGTLRQSNAKARIPLTTDVTKQMLNMSPIYGTVEETKPTSITNGTNLISEVNKICKNTQQTESYITNNIANGQIKNGKGDEVHMRSNYLQTAMTDRPSSNLLLRNSESIQPAPPVLPKPVYKRFTSVQNQSIDSKDNYNRQYNFKTGLKLTNRNSNCPVSNPQQNTPELLDELATILAKQKKKIDDALQEDTVVSKPPQTPSKKVN